MKKFFIVASGIFAVLLSSCLKDKPDVDFSTLKPILQAEYPAAASNAGLGSGLQYFGGSALLYPASDASDTAIVIINMDSPSPLGSAVTGTFGVIPTALTAYNADSLGLQYETMPDSDYTILDANFTIPAGKRIDTVRIVFFPGKIDPTHNYLLPAGITGAGSYAISQNFGLVYFHTIGNPIAGSYEEIWTRWNASDTSGAPAFDHEDLGATLFAPVTPTQVAVTSLGTGETDEISFADTAGVLSNFTVSLDPLTGITYTLASPYAILEVADPIHGYYRVYFTYLNGSGAARCIINEYYKN